MIRESQLISDCDNVISLIKDRQIKDDLVNYVKKGKYPCSLFIATWYLIRLGCIDSEIFPKQEQGKSLLNILPESFKPYEDKGLDIIKATKFASRVDDIKYHFISGRSLE